MTKVLKNFYFRAAAVVLVVFLAAFWVCNGVFSALAPAIVAQVNAAKEAALAAVTGGKETHELTDITLVDGVRSVLEADDGIYIITAAAQGAEGPVVLTIGLDAEGAVARIAVAEAEEAPEYGGRALGEEYFSKFVGLNSTNHSGLNSTASVDSFSGATYTSAAIKEAVDKALTQYGVLHGAEYVAPLTPEELQAAALTEYLGEGYTKAETAELADNVVEVYTSGEGFCMVTEADGEGGTIRLLIYMNTDGKVKKIVPIFHSEPVGRGDQYLTEAALFSYEGYSSYGYYDDGSGVCVFTRPDNTNIAIAKMLMGAVEQYKQLNPAP